MIPNENPARQCWVLLFLGVFTSYLVINEIKIFSRLLIISTRAIANNNFVSLSILSHLCLYKPKEVKEYVICRPPISLLE